MKALSCFSCFSSNPPDLQEVPVRELRNIGVGTSAQILCNIETQTDDPIELCVDGADDWVADSSKGGLTSGPGDERTSDHQPSVNNTPHVPSTPPPHTENSYKFSSRIPLPPNSTNSNSRIFSQSGHSSRLFPGAMSYRPGEKREFKNDQELEEALLAVFLEFARFGSRSDSKHLDSFRFMKLCRECCLVSGLGDTQCLDLIFYQDRKGSSGRLCAVFQERPAHPLGSQAEVIKCSKTKQKAFKLYSKCKEVNNKHKMSFWKFKAALSSIAELLGVEVVDVKKAIASSAGPLLHNVTLPQYQQMPDMHDTLRSDHTGAGATWDLEMLQLQDSQFDTSAMSEAPGLKILSPGTYPVGVVNSSNSSSGFIPDARPRVGSPRGGI